MRKKSGALKRFLAGALSGIMLLGSMPVLAASPQPEAPKGEIVAFAALPGEAALQTVPVGTAQTSLALPATLSATVQQAAQGRTSMPPATEQMEVAVAWASPAYNAEVPGTYTFQAEVTDGGFALSAVPPQITVVLEEPQEETAASSVAAASAGETLVVSSFAALADSVKEQEVLPGTALEEIPLPTVLQALVRLNGEEKEQEIPVTWEATSAYNKEEPGLYTFTAQLGEGYTLAQEANAPTIAVWVTAGFTTTATAADLASIINNYSGGSGSLAAAVNGNVITVTGTVTGANASLLLDINPDVTVQWEADISAAPSFGGDLVASNGTGPFIVQGAGQIRAISGIGLTTQGDVQVKDNALVSTETGVAINAYGAATKVSVSGSGEVSSTTGKAISSNGNVSVRDDARVAATTGYAIHSYDASGKVTVSGGVVTSDGETVIYGGPGSTFTISGGIILSTAANGYAINAYSAASVVVSGSAWVRSEGDNARTIFSQGDITVSGTCQVVAVGPGGYAIYNDRSGAVITVDGGVVFACHKNMRGDYSNGDGVIFLPNAGFSGPTANGLVIGWDYASYDPGNPYALESGTDLYVTQQAPNNAQAYWWVKNQSNGVEYAKNTNTGFIPLKVNLGGKNHLTKDDFIFTLQDYVYNGTPQGIASVQGPSGFDGTITVYYAGKDTDGTAYGPSITAPTNAGTYTVTVKTTETASYEASEVELGSYKIAKAGSGFTASTPATIYVYSTDTAQHTINLLAKVKLVATPPGDPVRVTYTLGAYADTSAVLAAQPGISGTTLTYQGAGKPTGTATQTVVIGSTNYTDITATFTFVAQKANVAVALAPAADITYGEALADPSAVVTPGGLLAGESFTFSYEGTDTLGNAYGPSATKPTKPGSYTVTATLVSATRKGGATAHFTINKANLSWVKGTVNNKVYDGTRTAAVQTNPQLAGIVAGSGDVVTVATGTAIFASRNASTSAAVIARGWAIGGAQMGYYNLPLSQSAFENATISQRPLEATATAASREYNGSTAVDVTLTPVLSTTPGEGKNLIAGDDVSLAATGTLASADAGAGKAVTISDIVMSGADAGNYLLPQASAITGVTANISKAHGLAAASYTVLVASNDTGNLDLTSIIPLTVPTGGSAGTVTYATGTYLPFGSGALTGEPTISGSSLDYIGKATPKSQEIQFVLVESTNYNNIVTWVIFKAVPLDEVTLAVEMGNITYGETLGDPTTTISPDGLLAGESITYQYTGTTTQGEQYALTGQKPTKPGNYAVIATLVSGTRQGGGVGSFTINKANLTWAAGKVNDKDYDGTTAAVLQTSPTLQGIVAATPADEVTVTAGTAVFASKNAGTRAITAQGWAVGGAQAGYYNAPGGQPGFPNAVISKIPLTITDATVDSKVYDGTTAGVVESITLGGDVDGLALGTDFSATAEFDSTDAGSGRTVTVSVALLDTDNAQNYIPPQPYNIAGQTIAKATGLSATHPTIIIYSDDLTRHGLSLSSALAPAGQGQGVPGDIAYQLGSTMDISDVLGETPALQGADDLAYQGDGSTSGLAIQFVSIRTTNYTNATAWVFFEAKGPADTEVTVTPPNNITYGETLGNPSAAAPAVAAPRFTYYYEGTGDTVYGPTTQKPIRPGTYSVTAVLENIEYQGSATAQFTIFKKALVWAPGTVADKVYDGNTSATLQTLPTITGLINEDPATVIRGMAVFAGPDAGGSVAVTAIGWGVRDVEQTYYLLPAEPPVFLNAAITKRPVTILIDDKSMTVGDALPLFTYAVQGQVAGETALASAPMLSSPTANIQAAGQYPIVGSMGAVGYTGNYMAASPAFVEGLLTVNGSPGTSSSSSSASSDGGGNGGGGSGGGATSSSSSHRPPNSKSVSSVSVPSSSRPASSSASVSASGSVSSAPVSSGSGTGVGGGTTGNSDAAQREHTKDELQQSGVPSLNLFGFQLFLYGTPGSKVWSVANLLLTVAGLLLSALLFAGQFMPSGQQYTGATRKKRLRLKSFGLLVALLALLLFLVTQHLQYLVVLFDIFTPVFVVLLAAQVVLAILGKKAKTESSPEEY